MLLYAAIPVLVGYTRASQVDSIANFGAGGDTIADETGGVAIREHNEARVSSPHWEELAPSARQRPSQLLDPEIVNMMSDN